MKNVLSYQVINTKLHPPEVAPESVNRGGLVSRLDDGLKNPVTHVSAPAGYGKTTLAAQWFLDKFIPPKKVLIYR